MPLPYIYVPNVPQGADPINETQQPINGNFQDISPLIAVDHIGFNTDGFGTHNFVTYVNQEQDPSTGANDIALYAKAVQGDPNKSQMFYRYPNNGSVNLLSLGSTPVLNSGSGGAITYSPDGTSWYNGYYQYLSNGILIMSWQFNIPTTQTTPPFTIAIPNGAGFPTFTQTPFNMQFSIKYRPSTAPMKITLNPYAITANSPTQATIYWNGTSNLWSYGCVTAIGI
jgi:hypothetical protein